MTMDGIEREVRIAIRDHVLVEGDVDGRPVAFRTLAVKVCPEELWLGMTARDGRLAALRTSQPLRLTVSRDGAGWLGTSAFLRPLGADGSRVFAVSRPEDLELAQRRVHPRYEFDADVRFRELDPMTKQPLGRSAEGSTVNVSIGGMLLRTSAMVSVGEEIDLTMPFGTEDRISSTNRVVRVRSLSQAPGLPGGPTVIEVGARFTRITSVDRDLLIRLALAAQRRRDEAHSEIV